MPDLNPTYGALFVGVLLSAVLFGVTMLQVFVYFQQYPSDRAWRKLAVCWLWFLDALHLALSAHFVYFYLVTNYDKPDSLSKIVWSFKLRIVVDALVVCSVHTLYTSRLWTLLAIDERMQPFGKEARRWSRQKLTARVSASRWVMRRLVPWLVSGLVALGYGIAIVMCVETFKLEAFWELAHAPWATYVPLGASTVIDGIIAGSLCYFLAQCRPRSEAMNGPFKTLMVYTLNTGTITGLCSLFTISMMVAYPTTFIPIAIEFTVVKLYINSYMAMLNARSVLHPSQDYTSRASFLPSNSRILRYPLEQKGLPFASFSASVASLHLPHRPPNPSPTPGAHHAPASDARASAEWTRPSPVPTLRAPRLSHPDVCPQYGAMETMVGVAFPAATLGQHAARFDSFTSASSSATVAVSPHLGTHPLAAAYATPVDPLTPSTAHPLAPQPTVQIEMVEITETTATAADPPEYPSPPDRALSPLRFASYSSETQTPSPSGSLSAPSSPTYARPSRPRLPSAFSTDTRDGEDAGLPSVPYGSPGPGLGSGSERRYTRMVNAARESRRTLGSFQSGTAGAEDERGVWVWGGPGSSSAGP